MGKVWPQGLWSFIQNISFYFFCVIIKIYMIIVFIFFFKINELTFFIFSRYYFYFN